jgi:glycosyltransferase involved in cell wall biosynthesis
MLNVVYVLSDSPVKPCGGLGERVSKMIPFLEKEMNIFIYCAGQGGKVSNTECKDLQIEVPDYGNPYPLFFANFVMDNPPPFKPDVVIATDYGTIMAAKTLAKIYGAKLVTEFHLAYYSLRKVINESELVGDMKLDQAAKMVSLIEETGATSSDLVIGCSSSYAKDLPWPAKKVVAIQNGIDFDKYQVPSEPYQFKGGKKKNIVFIGRINTQKGVKHLLDYYHVFDGHKKALVYIPDEHRLKLPEDTALHFVGGPVGSDQFHALIETVKNSDQKFHIPFVSGQEKINLLKSADAIVFPSIHEPFGIVGLEAFASGVPLITTGVDGIADYANESNSILCSPSARSVREAIDKLLSMDKEDIKKMTENGKKVAKKFRWDEIANQMIAEIKSIMD